MTWSTMWGLNLAKSVPRSFRSEGYSAGSCHTHWVKDADSKDRAVLSTILLTTMGLATFTALSLGLLAPVFIEDLGITRSDVGIVFSVNVIGAAVFSPIIGPYVDRIGGRNALVSIVGASAINYVIHGIAWSLGVMLIGSVFGAVAQAGANPSTNKLIADELPPRFSGCRRRDQTVRGATVHFSGRHRCSVGRNLVG